MSNTSVGIMYCETSVLNVVTLMPEELRDEADRAPAPGFGIVLCVEIPWQYILMYAHTLCTESVRWVTDFAASVFHAAISFTSPLPYIMITLELLVVKMSSMPAAQLAIACKHTSVRNVTSYKTRLQSRCNGMHVRSYACKQFA